VAITAPTANAPSDVTSSGFVANWSAIAAATGYRLDVSTNGAFSSYVNGYQNRDVGNVTSRAISGLSAGTNYYYRVRAYSGEGTSGNSNTVTVITVPAAPGANAATGVTSHWFTANWDNTTGATGYRLDVSRSSSFSDFLHGYQDRDVGNATSFGVKGLSANTTYYYRVRAYNTSGFSSNSNVITVMTGVPPSPTPHPSATPKPVPTPSATPSPTPRPSATPK
jgi:phosphodiesterase/alkaline phosphatase D-like protein